MYEVYAGSYTDGSGSEGIYHLRFCDKGGEPELSILEAYPECGKNPSFLAVTPSRVYAVSECMGEGAVSAFSRDPESGRLSLMNRVKTKGSNMCHLCLWPDGRHISAANYTSGSLLVCSLAEDGSMLEVTERIQHEGVGFEPVYRQEGPHVHSTWVSPDNRRLYAADLGLDQVFCYETKADGSLTLADRRYQLFTDGGDGPRHFVLSSDGRYFYLMTEMGNNVYVYESEDGGLTWERKQKASSLPGGFTGEDTSADIHLSADGRFLYTSDRGADIITVYARDAESGTLTVIGHFPCGGEVPRNFCLTPDGKYLLVANQGSGNIAVYALDPASGLPGEMLAEAKIPQVSFVWAG